MNIINFLKKVFYYWAISLGSIVTIICLMALLIIPKRHTPVIPTKAILSLDLDGRDQTFFEGSDSKETSFYEISTMIQEASKDDRIQAIFLKLTTLNISFAQIQELQDALKDFKKTGKKLYLYASSFVSTKEYYLASIFDEICMLSVGNVGIAGFRIEVPFIRNFLDKWNIKPNSYHVGKYKSSPETFTEKDFTQPHRESSLSLLTSMEEWVVKDIADWRKITNMSTFFQKGDLYAYEALDAKLITELGYLGSFKDKILSNHGKEVKFFSSKDYQLVLDQKNIPKNTKKIAILMLSGAIDDDRGAIHNNPLEDQRVIRPSKVSKQLKEILKDESTLGVILRIDSPGGTITASEEIWGQLKEFSKQKPVIASMGSVAASGGYYIASACSKIVAQPLTITGSIGVFGGKLNTSKFWENLGIHWGEIYTMESATLHSPNHDFSSVQQDRLQKSAEYAYDIFKQRVTVGRNLSLDDVEKVAQGRVWTGVQAYERKLVDALGGLKIAFEIAKKEINLKENEKVELYLHESRISFFDIIMNVLGFENEELDINLSLTSYFWNIFSPQVAEFNVRG